MTAGGLVINNSVVIASTAGFLVNMLREKLYDANFRVYVAGNDKDLFTRINNYFPKFIFIEQCFFNDVTDEYVNKIKKNNENLHIVIWGAYEISPFSIARFLNAGAESYFSLRETEEKVIKIIRNIMLGDTYFPVEAEKFINSVSTLPMFDVAFIDREIQIIKMFNLKDREIAKKLCVTLHTIKYHKTKIFRKCGMNSKYEVLKYVVEKGII